MGTSQRDMIHICYDPGMCSATATADHENPRNPGNQAIVFAGGGTGGHLTPALAIDAELQCIAPDIPRHFICSDRPIDMDILRSAAVAFSPLAVRTWRSRPDHWPAWLLSNFRAMQQACKLLREMQAGCVVSLGGFVSAPVILAACRMDIPVMMVLLDAAAGKAQRLLMRRADRIFATPLAAEATTQAHAISTGFIADPQFWHLPSAHDARTKLGLDPDRPTLMITGGSQGARSVNGAVVSALSDHAILERWRDMRAQVLHIAGPKHYEDVCGAYAQAALDAHVLAYCHQMPLAWAAADGAITRAGANTVAEAALSRTPTIFFPYPYHKDQHQRHNAHWLVKRGGGVMLDDRKDETANAQSLIPVLNAWLDRWPAPANVTCAKGAQMIAEMLMQQMTKSDQKSA